jgi:urea transport system permease protein
MPEVWTFAMGGLFIGIVLFLPGGVASLYQNYLDPYVSRILERAGVKTPQPADKTV